MFRHARPESRVTGMSPCHGDENGIVDRGRPGGRSTGRLFLDPGGIAKRDTGGSSRLAGPIAHSRHVAIFLRIMTDDVAGAVSRKVLSELAPLPTVQTGHMGNRCSEVTRQPSAIASRDRRMSRKWGICALFIALVFNDPWDEGR